MSSAELSSVGNQSRQLIFDQTKLHKVKESASRFRSLTETEKKQVLALKVGLAAGAVILALLTIVAIYYSSKATATVPVGHYQTAFDQFRRVYYQQFIQTGTKVVNIGAIAILPGLIGFGGVAGLAIPAVAINFESVKDRSRPNFSEHGAVEQELTELTRTNFVQLYAKFGPHSFRGLGPLVRHGLISEEQGKEMFALINHHQEQQAIVEAWERRGSDFTKQIQENRASYPAYDAARSEVEASQGKWERIRGQIIDNYSVLSAEGARSAPSLEGANKE